SLRMRLEEGGWWRSEDDVALVEQARADLDRSLASARARSRGLRGNIGAIFEHVYETPPAELQDQAAQAKADLLTDPIPSTAASPVRPVRVSHGEKLTLVEALRLALEEEMQQDDRVVLWGQDIAELGGVFRVTQGLLQRFGPRR